MTTCATSPPRPTTAGRRWWADPVRVLAAIVMLVLGALGPGVVWLTPAAKPFRDDTAGLTLTGVLVTVLACTMALVVTLLVVRFALRVDGGLRLRDIGVQFNHGSMPAFALGLSLSVAVVLVVGLPLSAAGLVSSDVGIPVAEPAWAVVTVGLARAFLLQGIGEEVVFRGYLLTRLHRSPVAAVVISAVSFAALHLLSSGGQDGGLERLLYLALPLGFGLAAGAVRLRTGSLWAAVGVHGGLHVGILIGAYLGVGTGPFLWVGTGVLWTAVAVVVLRQGPRRDCSPAAS